MIKFFTTFAVSILSFCSFAQSPITFHNYSAENICGSTVDFSQYYGKKVMVVNTASFCGYTPQFDDLQNLYAQYQQYNFEIIGFPCNDFNGQDPNSDSAINEFCTSIYGVTFLMMSKIATISADTAPVYKWLQREDLNGVANAHVAWNFNKFLIDEAGNWVAHHLQTVNPMDPIITNWIMSPSVVASVDPTVHSVNNLIQFIAPASGNSILQLGFKADLKKMNISIYSVDGKFMQTIYSGQTNQGQQYSFNVSNLSAGMYFISAQSNEYRQVIKYALVK